MKIAVLVKDGVEELEALGIVDMARRAEIQCDIASFAQEYITGSNGIGIKADIDFNDIDNSYDALVLPGGPASSKLRDDNRVIELVKKFNNENKVIGAICAAPIVLERAGVINSKTVTSYPTVSDQLVSANYEEAIVQVDGNIVTGKGPAATFSFAFLVLETLGIDVDSIKEGTQYNYFINNEN